MFIPDPDFFHPDLDPGDKSIGFRIQDPEHCLQQAKKVFKKFHPDTDKDQKEKLVFKLKKLNNDGI
jgi:hypothetical protein